MHELRSAGETLAGGDTCWGVNLPSPVPSGTDHLDFAFNGEGICVLRSDNTVVCSGSHRKLLDV